MQKTYRLAIIYKQTYISLSENLSIFLALNSTDS